MTKSLVINHVEIAGENFEIEKLSEEKQKQLSEMWQERMMQLAGYQRCSA